MRAYLLKEDFQGFWDYVSPTWAGKFLDRWCTRTMRSQLKPMKTVALMLRRHRELILNWFRAKGLVSTGAVRGAERQGESDHQKILRLQDLQSHRSGPLPHAWQAPRARGHPQILLRRRRELPRTVLSRAVAGHRQLERPSLVPRGRRAHATAIR